MQSGLACDYAPACRPTGVEVVMRHNKLRKVVGAGGEAGQPH